ncbi:MAG: prepilin peptidase [Candidatus Levybacteria bacterium]|nr:prepilin peptidase [Candidatus Levybacteria bacterium]
MNSLFAFYIFVIGLFIGSFLNVLIDRIPKRNLFRKKRSYCDSCKKTLKWYDLIPVFSFIFLQGKCRYCRFPISLYYPIVELITASLFVLTFNFISSGGIMNQELRIMDAIGLVYYLFIISSFIVVFFTDLKYGIIPDKVLLAAISLSIFYLFFIHNSLFMIHLLSGVGAFLLFLLLHLITRGKGMGFGDVKLVFLIGLFLGILNAILALYLAFLTGAVVGLILILWGKRKFFGGKIPFGPFLVLGTFISLFLGEKIIKVLLW